MLKTPPTARLRQNVHCLIDDRDCCSYEAKRDHHTFGISKMLSYLHEEPSYLNTLHLLHFKRTFCGRAGNTILKKILKDLCLSGSGENCDVLFVDKNVYDFYFLFVSFGLEWHILHFYI